MSQIMILKKIRILMKLISQNDMALFPISHGWIYYINMGGFIWM